jgi:hypothetical protein
MANTGESQVVYILIPGRFKVGFSRRALKNPLHQHLVENRKAGKIMVSKDSKKP